MTVTRLGTANMYDRTINNINQQQQKLASQMEHASAGKSVIRASDDPVAAAQAERARTRLSRVDTDQRSLDAQTATVKYAESSLGEIYSAVQEFRSLLVNAGNGSYTQTERDALVAQMQSLRDQVLNYANRSDSNGLPLFGGLDSQQTPFPGGSSAMQAGQAANSEYGITSQLDGAAAFLSGKTGNGVLAVQLGRPDPSQPGQTLANQGKAWADVGMITDPRAATNAANPTSIAFAVAASGAITYTVDDGSGPSAAQPYTSGQAISVAGMSLTISGVPADGDGFTIAPSTQIDLFSVLDSAIATARNSGNLDGSTAYGSLAHGIAKSLSEIDTGLNRVSTVRSLAGDLLNQADRMGSTLLARSEQMEAQRSAAEDIDMVAALSQLKTQETTVSAALQSYATIQKLSLFNYIS